MAEAISSILNSEGDILWTDFRTELWFEAFDPHLAGCPEPGSLFLLATGTFAAAESHASPRAPPARLNPQRRPHLRYGTTFNVISFDSTSRLARRIPSATPSPLYWPGRLRFT